MSTYQLRNYFLKFNSLPLPCWKLIIKSLLFCVKYITDISGKQETVSMKPLAEEIAEETWREFAAFTPAQVNREAGKVAMSQPNLSALPQTSPTASNTGI
jgi:hypothetical protein